jgi:GT2 family glycosyltransferase
MSSKPTSSGGLARVTPVAILADYILSPRFVGTSALSLESVLVALSSVQGDDSISRLLLKSAGSISSGQIKAALGYLEYIQRALPSHRWITLLIGDLRLSLMQPNASEPFEFLAKRHNWQNIWLRLALVRLRNGRPDYAASELHEALSRSATLPDPHFIKIADKVTAESHAVGWCGLNNSGRIVIGGLADKTLPLEIIGDSGHRVEAKPIIRRERWLSNVLVLQIEQTLDGIESVSVSISGIPLIGSPILTREITRVEGFLESGSGVIEGWCAFPAEPNAIPLVTISSTANSKIKMVVRAEQIDKSLCDNFGSSLPRRFRIDISDKTKFHGSVNVTGPYNKALYGSPVNPMGIITSARASAKKIAAKFPACVASENLLREDFACEISIPVSSEVSKPTVTVYNGQRSVLVIIPVYRGYTTTVECIESVLRARTVNEKVLVVVDASPDRKLVSKLEELCDSGLIELSIQTVNRGFPATANIGLRRAAALGFDAILLNSDTLVSDHWVTRLRDAIRSSDDIGTATPFSNAATIFSYPVVDKTNDTPDLDEVCQLAQIAHDINGSQVVETPTAHGFCMYIRNECLLDTGLLREDVFGQGYGEENDFAMRARHLGWKHVAAPGVYVGHLEGQSFASAKSYLTSRNLRVLNRLHPGYDKLVADWVANDPLAPFRRQLDLARWRTRTRNRKVVIFVTHDREGGVLKHVEKRAAEFEKSGLQSIVISPRIIGTKRCCIVRVVADASLGNLAYGIGEEGPALIAMLSQLAISHIELHHFIGFRFDIVALLRKLSAPYDIHIHDYALFCPRITLTSGNNRYCGEPSVASCMICIRDHGTNLGEHILPDELIARSSQWLSMARDVIVPSVDVARRFSQRFAIRPKVIGWEDERVPLQLKPVRRAVQGKDVRRICIVGAIGYEKGYDILLECARIVDANKLPIEFIIVGFTCDDKRLLETDSVKIIGRYEEKEGVDLIRQQNADFGLLPALWPETWSYVLSQLWEAQLPVVSFNLGTPSERIQKRHGGVIYPLGLSPKQLVNQLLHFTFPATVS